MNSSIKRDESGRNERFVSAVIERSLSDNGLAARLRRATNPSTEYQSWDFLASMGVDLEWENKRLPFALVAASIAREKATMNGSLPLGKAVAAAFDEGADSMQAKSRIRRLLACSSIAEVCRVLRPTISLIQSREGGRLDYVRLLSQLRRFSFDSERVKAQWAEEFYRTMHSKSGDDA